MGQEVWVGELRCLYSGGTIRVWTVKVFNFSGNT